uniref:Similar to YSL6 (YELLOW STRIPE LIKE 6) n=1 Tax=Arundo donax TaxID=35708 RepID=A0A0A9D947_ARUDO
MANERKKVAQQISRQCNGRAEKPSIPRMAISPKMTANGALYSPSGSPMSKAVQKSHSASGAMMHPSAMPISWATNIDRGEERVRYPLLKSCMRSAVEHPMDMMMPHAASPAMTPLSLPTSEATAKSAILPYVGARFKLVRPIP